MGSLCGSFEFKNPGKDGSEVLSLGIRMHSVWDDSFDPGKGKNSSLHPLRCLSKGSDCRAEEVPGGGMFSLTLKKPLQPSQVRTP